MKSLFRNSLIAGTATFAALAAGVVHADDNQTLDACIKEFIASNLSGYQGNISVHKSAASIPSVPLVAGHRSEVVISAAHAHGSEFASAVCQVDREGKVISMTLTSGAAKLSKVMTPSVAPVVADTH